MNSIFDEMEADSDQGSLFSGHSLSKDDLSTLTGFADAIEKQKDLVATLEMKLVEQKDKLLKMTDHDLPSLMTEANCTEFILKDGSKVTIKPQYGGSIKVENRPAAFKWLRDNEYDDIIKNTVACQFGRGEDNLASSFKAFAKKQGYDPIQTEKIEPMSLRGFIKERVENGDEFPMDLFGAFIGQRAIITKAKGGKNGKK